jgi:hypothetical protein
MSQIYNYGVKGGIKDIRCINTNSKQKDARTTTVTTQKMVIHFLLIKVPNFGPR